MLSPCTAGVGSCRGQITVHFFLGQQWLTGCRGALIARCLFSLTLEKSSPPLVQCSFWLDLLPQSWWELRQDGLAWSRSKVQGRRLVVKSLSLVLIIEYFKKTQTIQLSLWQIRLQVLKMQESTGRCALQKSGKKSPCKTLVWV